MFDLKKISIGVGGLLLVLLAANAFMQDAASTAATKEFVRFLPSVRPDEQFSFVSTERTGNAPSAQFEVSLWLAATKPEPCIARVKAPAGSPHLTALAASVNGKGIGQGFSLGEELLGKCSGRFVHIDGGASTPGKWSEWIGNGAEGVDHDVRVRAIAPGELILEFRPGHTPAKASDVARLEKLICDIDQLIAGRQAVIDATQKRTRYQYELDRLKATDVE